MNCHDPTRNIRYSEFSTSSEAWCGSADDYYNENYLPNDGNLATMSASDQQPPPAYESYYEYQHPPPHHPHEASVIHSASGTTPPPPPLTQQHGHIPPHHPHNNPVSSYPLKRSSSQEIMYNNNNNNYNEPKSPSSSSVTTSPPWSSFHSFYHAKNPSASPTSNNSIGSSPPPSTSIGPLSSGEIGTATSEMDSPKLPRPSFKRRTTANKKERRRTQSINNAFADLRDHIPNVPADTKLSKIKTLRLATSYIAYLSEVLSGDDPLRTPQPFTAELSKKMGRGDEKRRKELLMQELAEAGMKQRHHHHHNSESRKAKGRTGWPQHVWALELQQ